MKKAAQELIALADGLDKIQGYEKRLAYIQANFPRFKVAMKTIVVSWLGWVNYATKEQKQDLGVACFHTHCRMANYHHTINVLADGRLEVVRARCETDSWAA